jgi:acyl-CoA synthetase (AMP-forming)/AMP-acid ligase II
VSTTLATLLDGDGTDVVVTLDDMQSTRRELLNRAAEVQLALADLDGRAIGVCLPNGPDVVAAWFGVWRAGAAVVPLNPRAPKSERDAAITASGVAAIVDADGVHVVDTSAPGTDAALIQFTSGTTGRPKAVPLQHETIDALLDSVIGTLRGDRTARARMPNIVPLSLSLWAGIYQVLFAFKLRVPVVLMHTFEPREFARLVREHGIRSSVLPPAALVMLLADPEITTLEPLRYIRSVSAPLSPAHARKFHERFGIAILNGYGQTELGGEAIGWSAEDWKAFGVEKLGAVGRPHDAFSARIHSADAAEPGMAQRGSHVVTGETEIGELEIRSSQALPPSDAAMEGRVTDDGWLRTGDLARIDDDGFVWIEGRVSDMINRGGLKVFPDDVEEQLRVHPSVHDAAVVGIADERLGEVPWAFVIPAPDASLDVVALRAWCREQMVAYKIPAGFTVVDSFPRNEAGKVLRNELRSSSA